MINSSRENLRKILSNSLTLKKIINALPINIEKTKDTTNLTVWGILNKIDKEKILSLLDKIEGINQEEFSPSTKREIMRTGIKIIRFIDSIGTHEKVLIQNGDKNELASKMKIPGIALEYFLLDTITRLNKKNKITVKAEKGPSELEGEKVDFILTSRNIKLGVQLTLSEGSVFSRKQAELKEKMYKIEMDVDKEKEILSKSSRFISDAPVLMIVNSETSRQTQNDSILLTAYNKWKKNGFNTGGPARYLGKDIQDELNLIGLNLQYIIDIAIKFIKNTYNKGDVNNHQEKDINNLNLVYDGDKLKISFFNPKELNNTDKKPIYSFEIYITSKLLKKIGVKRTLVEHRHKKTIKRMQNKKTTLQFKQNQHK